MNPQKNISYLIEYHPDGSDKTELAYAGHGTYRGEYIEDKEGNILYLMEDLQTEKGFTKNGWFSSEDIKAELKYE
jgi:hypothetical protein